MDITLYASLAYGMVATIGGLVLAAKLANSRADVEALEEVRAGLKDYIAEIKPDATLGRKTRLQRDAALRKAMAVNSARKAEKAALANAVN